MNGVTNGETNVRSKKDRKSGKPRKKSVRGPEAVEKLVTEHKRLAYSAWIRFRNASWAKGLDQDDGVQACLIGLARAAELYLNDVKGRTGSSVAFSTYAYYHMRGSVQREAIKARGKICLVMASGNGNGTASPYAKGKCYIEQISVEDTNLEDRDQGAYLQQLLQTELSKLRIREVLVLRLLYGLDGGREHTLREVGEIIGVSHQRVRQIHYECLEKIRVSVEKDGHTLD
jgi:RNA polymerase sigma factor (sigma-70 family)